MARILIIEDEPGIAFILKEVLTDQGHEVITAKDGLSGMKKLEHEPKPDLVMLDYRLPLMNGKSIIEKMNRSEELKEIPKILMSGSIPNAEDFPDQNSYQAFISKPFDIFEVVRIVEDRLTKSMKPCLSSAIHKENIYISESLR